MRPLFVLISLFTAVPAFADVEVGKEAPAFTLSDHRGKSVSLADYKGKVVVLEWFNPGCPFVVRHMNDKTMTTTAKKHPEVVWLGINSTARDHKDYRTPAELAAWAKGAGISYPLLLDTDGAVGKSYGAKTTPHMFVIDPSGKVAYAGAIDDDPSGRSELTKRKNYVDLALTSLKRGEKPAENATKSYGCSVKYGS